MNVEARFRIKKIFLEVIIANGFDENALKILKSKKDLRLIDSSNYNIDETLKFNSINNSMFIQSEDKKIFIKKTLELFQRKNLANLNLITLYLH